MMPTIRAFRSTFNLLLSIVQLFIGLAFAVKVFGSDVSSGGSLVVYMADILDMMGQGTTTLLNSSEISGPLAFLVLVFGFMIFSCALFLSIPAILQQSKRNAELEGGYD